MPHGVSPASLAAVVLAVGGAGCIPLDGYDPLECAPSGLPMSLSGLSPAVPADYVELRVGVPGEWEVLDHVGTACATATDPEACAVALDEAGADARLLLGECVSFCPTFVMVVNRGDEVEVIPDAPTLTAYLGAIDTPDDAVALSLAAGFALACDDVAEGGVRAAGDGFELIGTRYTSLCSPVEQERVQLGVSAEGEVTVLANEVIHRNLLVCIGRRPAGLRAGSAPRAEVGEWLAAVTTLEAAAVVAFGELADALEAHGAPDALVARVTEARHDEVEHTRTMARLARAHGARVAAPEVVPSPGGDLEALATANAVEGCVRETLGALIGLWQARHAEDGAIRAAMATIAADEARHATLSWDLAAWFDTQLPVDARARVHAARGAALADLRDGGHADAPAALCRSAGLPSAAEQRRLALGLHALVAA